MTEKKRFKLPECGKCKHKKWCASHKVERHSLYCLWNLYPQEEVDRWYFSLGDKSKSIGTKDISEKTMELEEVKE